LALIIPSRRAISGSFRITMKKPPASGASENASAVNAASATGAPSRLDPDGLPHAAHGVASGSVRVVSLPGLARAQPGAG
jgi:hypothetical protein